MTLVVHAPLHARPSRHPRRLGVAAVAVAAVLTVGLAATRPSVSSWRARGSRPVPAVLLDPSGGTLALGLLALDDPVPVVFGALGEPQLTSSSVTRTTMTWPFDGATVAVTLSVGLLPAVVAIDAWATDDVGNGPVFAGGIEVGRSTLGALVGRLGPPTVVGHPLPTSARWARCHSAATVVIDADAGTWASSLSGRVRHVRIGYDDGSFGGLCEPDRR
jgi:hypothetical protein